MTEQTAEQQTEVKTEQKPGTEFVDFADLPPEVREKVEPRFKRLYWNLKEHERALVDIGSRYKVVEDELLNLKQNHVNQKTEDELTGLRREKIAALERADYVRAAELDEKIFEIKAQPKKAEVKQPETTEAQLGPTEMAAYQMWSGQTDQNGNLMRPWTQKTHPLFSKAMAEVHAVGADPRFSGEPVEKILQEIDRRMGITGRPAAQQVLGASQTRQVDKKIALSEDEKRVARRLYRLSGIVKNDDEAFDRYLKAKGTK
ncbi:MAG: hypothetical protein C4523_02470 [Myxococcales bacterium]|nr:MAG: hypothetical protein C4523_02470 [Myxococcales bacterium]